MKNTKLIRIDEQTYADLNNVRYNYETSTKRYSLNEIIKILIQKWEENDEKPF